MCDELASHFYHCTWGFNCKGLTCFKFRQNCVTFGSTKSGDEFSFHYFRTLRDLAATVERQH